MNYKTESNIFLSHKEYHQNTFQVQKYENDLHQIHLMQHKMVDDIYLIS